MPKNTGNYSSDVENLTNMIECNIEYFESKVDESKEFMQYARGYLLTETFRLPCDILHKSVFLL